jgi:ElaB/YqjD/DUF883 family membrane-anchored ribosome-binding protein
MTELNRTDPLRRSGFESDSTHGTCRTVMPGELGSMPDENSYSSSVFFEEIERPESLASSDIRVDHSGRGLHEKAHELGEKLGGSIHSLTDNVKDFGGKLGSRLSHLKDDLSMKASSAKDMMSTKAEDLRESVENVNPKLMLDRAACQVKMHPERTMMIAAGAGVFLGLLLGAKSRHSKHLSRAITSEDFDSDSSYFAM